MVKPPSKYKQLTGRYKYTYDGNVPKYYNEKIITWSYQSTLTPFQGFCHKIKPLNSIEQFKMEQYHISRPSIDTNRRVTNKLDTLTFVTFFPIKTRFKSDLRNVKWLLKINSTWTNSYFLKVFLLSLWFICIFDMRKKN